MHRSHDTAHLRQAEHAPRSAPTTALHAKPLRLPRAPGRAVLAAVRLLAKARTACRRVAAVLAVGLGLGLGMAHAAVDLNKATQAELETVKGIGPGLSAKIIEARKAGNFKSWADFVERVPGVGEGNAAKISDGGLVVAGAPFDPKAMPAAAPKAAAAKAAAPTAAKPAAATPAAGATAKAAAATAPAKP